VPTAVVRAAHVVEVVDAVLLDLGPWTIEQPASHNSNHHPSNQQGRNAEEGANVLPRILGSLIGAAPSPDPGRSRSR